MVRERIETDTLLGKKHVSLLDTSPVKFKPQQVVKCDPCYLVVNYSIQSLNHAVQ